MFDLGMTEIFVIVVIAILVVAPKDLPALMRTVGQTIGKARRMARDFQRQLTDAIRDEELEQLQKDMADLGSGTDAEIRRGVYGRTGTTPPSEPGVSSASATPAEPVMTPLAAPSPEQPKTEAKAKAKPKATPKVEAKATPKAKPKARPKAKPVQTPLASEDSPPAPAKP